MKKWQKFVFGEITWKRLFKSLLTIYVMLLVVAVSLGDFLIFVPPSPNYTIDSEHISLIDGPESQKIATYYRPAKEDMPTLLWSHGNAEDLSNTLLYEQLHEAGFGIYAYDYPGYGLSTGSPSDNSCYATIEKVYESLTQQHGVPANKIILVGQSVGSGPTTYLASQQPAAAMVLVTPITSIYRVAFKYPIFPRDRFPNIQRIKDISIPLMVIHGDQDTIVPQSHGRALIAAHPGKHVFHDIKDRGHNDIYGTTLEEYQNSVELFTEFSDSIKR